MNENQNNTGRTVYIGNLPFNTTVEEITEELCDGHKPVRVSIPKDSNSGRPRGFAFVEFADADTAQKIVASLDGDTFGDPDHERTLKASIAKERPEKTEKRAGKRPRRHRGGGREQGRSQGQQRR